jgi:hypothetical protein
MIGGGAIVTVAEMSVGVLADVLVDVGLSASVRVGLEVSVSGKGIGSGGMRKLQDRIKPIKTRLRGMIT